MFWILILLVFAFVCIMTIKDGEPKNRVLGIGMAVGALAGILASVALSKTPSKSSGNPYFLYTLIVILFAMLPTFGGAGVGTWLRKKIRK